jgi:hypothetical protein
MKKIRCYLAIVALIATLSVPVLQGIGSVANAASSHYASSVSASSVVGKSTRSVAITRDPPCPVIGSDC